MNKNQTLPDTIFYGKKVWESIAEAIDTKQPSSVFILTDTNTKRFCLPVFLEHCKIKSKPTVFCIEANEEHKTLETCLSLWQQLLNNGVDRNSLLINLGGGLITDLGGFVAATYKRGISFIHIPTSLLAMVDAAIGGKNGVNFNHSKNQIGTIVSPYKIAIVPSFLKTLPEREFVSGSAEMFKHGLIASRNYWEVLKQTPMSYNEDFSGLILQSIVIKNNIVAQDKFEKKLRKTLNYGHTLGHAIESFMLINSQKKPLLHGEAIAIGMILETYISSELLNFPKKDLKEITNVLLQYFPKIYFSKDEINSILTYTKTDKKNRNGKVLFVLLEEIGVCQTDMQVADDLIFKAFDFYLNF